LGERGGGRELGIELALVRRKELVRERERFK